MDNNRIFVFINALIIMMINKLLKTRQTENLTKSSLTKFLAKKNELMTVLVVIFFNHNLIMKLDQSSSLRLKVVGSLPL